MVGGLSVPAALVLIVVSSGLAFADAFENPYGPSSSSILVESGVEEEEVAYSGLLVPHRDRIGRERWGPLLHFRVFEFTYDTLERGDLRVLSVGLVEPFSRLGVGVTLGERQIYHSRYPVMNRERDIRGRLDIACWLPVELHFTPYTFRLPGFPRNRFFRAFLGSIDIYYRFSGDRANFLYADDFFSVYQFEASYFDAGVGFESPFLVLRVGVHHYKIRPSSSLEISVLEAYEDTMVYVSTGIGVQALLGAWASSGSQLGLAPWFGVGR